MTTPQPPEPATEPSEAELHVLGPVGFVIAALGHVRAEVGTYPALSSLAVHLIAESLLAQGVTFPGMSAADGVGTATPADPREATFRDCLGDIADSHIPSPSVRHELIDDVMDAYRELHPAIGRSARSPESAGQRDGAMDVLDVSAGQRWPSEPVLAALASRTVARLLARCAEIEELQLVGVRPHLPTDLIRALLAGGDQ